MIAGAVFLLVFGVYSAPECQGSQCAATHTDGVRLMQSRRKNLHTHEVVFSDNATIIAANESAVESLDDSVKETLQQKLLEAIKMVETLHADETIAAEAAELADKIEEVGHRPKTTRQAVHVLNKAVGDETLAEAFHNHLAITASDFTQLLGVPGEERSDAFQGDMIPSSNTQLAMFQHVAKRQGRKKANASYVGAGKPWTGAVVNYCYASDASDDVTSVVPIALDQLARAVPCLSFVDVGHKAGTSAASDDSIKECNGDGPAIFVQSDPSSGCWSYVGELTPPIFIGTGFLKSQMLNLGVGCTGLGTVMHEFLHALGMAHEQSRPDRDDFVIIHWENIQEGKEHNFEVDDDAYDDALYDFVSIMHYDADAFSTTGEATITALGHDGELGQRTGMSQGDAYQLARMYAEEVKSCTANSLDAEGSMMCTDLEPEMCADLTSCSTSEHGTSCCACGGGIESKCYEGMDCPYPEPLANEATSCINPWTGHSAYPCLVRNECDQTIKVTCHSKPGWYWPFAPSSPNMWSIPPSGWDVCDADACEFASM